LTGLGEERRSAEMIEVEVDGDGIALRGIHVNGGGAGGKVFGGEVELESGAGELATAFLGAEDIRLAGRRKGPELLVVAGDLHIEIFPEVIRTWGETVGRTGAGTGRANDVCGIRISELNLNDDSHEFFLIPMVNGGLLGTVTG
jgi:hypothetical protein